MLNKLKNKLLNAKRQYNEQLTICFILIACIFFFFVLAAFCNDIIKGHEKPFKATVPAKVVSVHDGDTISVTFYVDANIRMLDCWAAEINSKDDTEKQKGLAARDYLQSVLKPADEVVIEIPFDEKITNSLTFGRILGKIYKDVDGDGKPDNVSDLMVSKGFATKEKQNENN